MKKTIYVPIIDNGMGLSRTKWARCLWDATLSGAFGGWIVTHNHFSSPYPNGVMNIVAADFLRSGCEDMFLHDTDIIYNPEHLAWLLSHDHPYVGGIVPKRVMGLELAMYPYEPLAPDPMASGVNPLVSADFGRGFCRINRSVFETLSQHVPTYSDDQEDGHNGELRHEFFRSKPGGHSEDFAFCELARKHGYNPCIDQRITLLHEGSAVYPIKGTY